MTFGYNADAAFGDTTAKIIDHAKDLLSSLIDQREEDDVGRPHSQMTCLVVDSSPGNQQAHHIHRTFAWGNCGQTSQ